ncbi:excalibur calcium-binding domain-containing protein [Hyphomicrobium sp.]|uniref:excalibur calcium-binding domain-containing protein n=1 Tax=Hyphomicrobium sp. TaxID=82 RepID=UPI002D778BF8|nr:excalibur calcium-binding domain-containing protein [Hyphomicrobium sp.]HET6387810.1 excalibur calcium-binding domain-containing protein [Hyphomicrobium sp.]
MTLDDHHREGREAAWRGNRRSLGLEADGKAGGLRVRLRRAVRPLWPWLLLGCVGGSLLAIASASPWPLDVTVRHFLASSNCKTARAVGLAPAVRGEPGYWPRNDADDDGIACEPWPRP